MRILAIIGILLIGILLIVVGAGGATWYAKKQQRTNNAQTVLDTQSQDPSETGSRTGAAQIEGEMVRQLLALVDTERRDKVLGSPELFAKFIEQERANQAVLTAAYANSADRNEAVSTLMLRASQKVLAEAYLTQVVRRNLDTSFPSTEQAKEFYEANKGSFRLPDRVHLWQIFVPVADGADEAVVAAAATLATKIAADLKKEPNAFAALAAKHSKHIQSRVNDGYMGLLKTGDLLPEIRQAVDELKPDAISKPVRTNAGFHLIKRGQFVAGSQLEFSAVQARITNQMKREAANRVRQAAVKKILDTYPVAVDETVVDQWRSELQSAEWPTALAN